MAIICNVALGSFYLVDEDGSSLHTNTNADGQGYSGRYWGKALQSIRGGGKKRHRGFNAASFSLHSGHCSYTHAYSASLHDNLGLNASYRHFTTITTTNSKQ